MLVCKEATRLVSLGMDRPLTLSEQVQLRFHLTICSGCRNFSRQVHLLRKLSRQLVDRDDEPPQDGD